MKKLLSIVLSIFLIACFLLFIGCFPSPEDLTAEEKEGYELHQIYCQQCHPPQSPKLHTADDWPETVERMQKYMQERDKKVMNEEQKQKILFFLKSQARK